ncbi:hypothetical protein BEL04_17700 [Mucilaginibacter sp. PPCGB 2223]|uniref:hypothetical protein n=1 Tax=Mucilaginibacter sp. PPCGB 2223 TaxID=1886027 RepID=UPI0008258A93|nr:hypothetical protein [Mucilaginibacter sp. PPCGB 2223]OCX51845.1 hypothetical protein BEL04_17700 [Mucilaginibacter sp. PPCGB 2223]
MLKLKLALLTLLIFLSVCVKATTWDEPWQDQVVKKSEYFVLAKVLGFDANKNVTINILKQFGGQPLSGKISITNFYLLSLCSESAGEGPEFHFKGIDSCYFFIKKNSKNEYCIATPTTGFAAKIDGQVYATYRHSYHQALIEPDIYEKTMTAIFNNYHGLPYDKTYLNTFINKYLSIKPAAYSNSDEKQTAVFFNQHVALESIYHLGLTGYYGKILPFLDDEKNFHSQVSAARALTAYNTAESKKVLLSKITKSSTGNFVKVICIWTLKTYHPTELKQQLINAELTASSKENGFGGNIMDPRVCTQFPTVKKALTELVASIK